MAAPGGEPAPHHRLQLAPDPAIAPASPARAVCEQSLARYLDLVELETDDDRREQLLRLLLEEQERSGSLGERFERSELLIRRSRARMDRQRIFISELIRAGRDTGPAQRALANLVMLVDLLEDYHELMDERLDVFAR